MKIVLAFFILIFASSLLAYEKEFIVTSILSDEVIKVEKLNRSLSVENGDLLVIYSHESKNVIGYARVELAVKDEDFFTASVQTHNKSSLIRVDNYLRKADLVHATGETIPGRLDLIIRNETKIAAKYRHLVYTGLAQGFTASNLVKGEYLAGPSIFGYGISSRWQVHTNLISTMFKILNLSFKNTIYSSDEYELSVENGFQYYNEEEKSSYVFTGYLDMISNAKFNSFVKLRVFTRKPEDEFIYNSEEYLNELNVELSYSYGYIFDNWNRLIFGPKVDINKKKVGGVIGYYYIDKEFHSMFGVSSNDFSEFNVGKQGYLLNLDFWWRF
jgi:hypothetical protein